MVREDGYVSPLELNEPSWIDDTVRYFASQAQHIYIIYTITPSTLLLLLLLFFGGKRTIWDVVGSVSRLWYSHTVAGKLYIA